jgi:hypothetical protein
MVITTLITIQSKDTAAEFCPVCDTVLNAARNVAKNEKKLKISDALNKYCAVTSLDVDHVKFCYNIDTIKRDLFRILDVGASNDRVCKKVLAVNKDFCQLKQSISSSNTLLGPIFETIETTGTENENKTTDSNASIFPPNFRPKRGFVYI